MNRGKVNVVLRVKPLEDGRSSEKVTVVDNEVSGASVILKKSSKTEELFQYRFHRALENASQDKTYQVCGEEVINSCLEGYNGTIIAYGQTGAGKTYTMFGPDGIGIRDTDFHGIMPKAIEHVFTSIERCIEWQVKMTYVEIYNETFRDLLSNSRTPISVLDNTTKSRGSTSLKGCSPTTVKSKNHAFNLLLKGQESRMVAAHAMNDRSSRSHAIVTLWIETTDEDGRIQKSKLNMVDLAGSERVRKTGTTGTIAKEATYINKSLSCLSLVAKELRRKALHVHYRDSKLTHYLKDSIGGNCRTLMVACVWGNAANFGESLSTCRFADDIQNVEVTASKNSGIESVHGKLFKMNPAMAKYIDQMMEKRVQQEKAKMFRNLKKRGLVSAELDEDGFLNEDEKALPENEKSELEVLRNKVKAMEEVENARQEGMSKVSALSELEGLRQKVSKLEVEKREVQDEMSKQMKDAECSLLEEMQELRVKVCELQKLRALTRHESMELYALRERMTEVANRASGQCYPYEKEYHSWHPRGYNSAGCDLTFQGSVFQPEARSKMGISVQVVNESSLPPPVASVAPTMDPRGCWESVEQQARVVGELEGLRDRLKQLHDVAVEKLSKENFEELTKIKNKIVTYQNTHSLQETSECMENSHVLDELETMKNRLRDLHSIPADQLKHDNLQELAQIKNKISHLQNDDKVKGILLSREVEKSRSDKSEGSYSYVDSSTIDSPPSHIQSQKFSISSEFSSSISVESPARASLSSQVEPMQKPIAPLKVNGDRPREMIKVSTSPRRMTRHLSNIPPFPGSQAAGQINPEPQMNQMPGMESSQESESFGVDQSVMQTKFLSKNTLRKKMSSQFWKLVGYSKHGNHQQQLQEEENEREKSLGETDNIVILNSLTHDQLLELLRDRYSSQQPSLEASIGSAGHLFDSSRHRQFP